MNLLGRSSSIVTYDYFKYRKKYLKILKEIDEIKKMKIDDALEYMYKDSPFLFCRDLKHKYKLFRDFSNLIAFDILNVNYFKVKEDEKALTFILEYKNGKKESLILDDVNIEYKECEEDELVFDDGIVTLYSKNLNN